MKIRKSLAFSAAVLSITILSGAAVAQQTEGTQDLIDTIIKDVVDETIDRARKEVERATGIDPLETGYERGKIHSQAPADASDETKRELQKLDEEHDRKIVKLEEELDRKLSKAREEFEREAEKEDKSDKIEEKRVKLEEKVERAQSHFEKKASEENARFDHKREHILSKSRGGDREDKDRGKDKKKDKGKDKKKDD